MSTTNYEARNFLFSRRHWCYAFFGAAPTFVRRCYRAISRCVRSYANRRSIQRPVSVSGKHFTYSYTKFKDNKFLLSFTIDKDCSVTWYTSQDHQELHGILFPDGTWFMVGRNDINDRKVVAVEYAPAGIPEDVHQYGLVITVE